MNGLVQDAPKLDAPGAGLPYPELLAARVIFHSQRMFASRKDAEDLFRDEQARISRLARDCEPGKGAQRVLIKRLRGMEDSSRHWSVYMTLDHLRIVNLACMGAIRSLTRGQVPERVASTAAVKPSPEVDEGVISDFEQTCELLVKTADGAGDLRSKVRYAHPWFGPLDAAGWYFMAGFHMRLHRKQIEVILAGINSSKKAVKS